MAAEPINIFSQKRDLAGIAALIRQLAPGAKITGTDDAWERITIEGTKSLFRKAPKLVFKNAPDYYSGPEWPQQVAGMQGYFRRFPDVPRKQQILRIIGTFQFALAIEFDPDLYIESNDPRLRFLFAVTKQVDGVLFTPSGLRDAAGRALLCADGRSDDNAILPAVPVVARPPVSAPPAKLVEPEIEDEESTPPEAKRVGRRALCLAAVAGRGLLEVEEMPPEQAEANRQRLLNWIGELAIDDELEPQELSILQKPVGTLERQATVNATWRLEALGVLAWALGRFEVAAYDELVDAGKLFPAIGFLDVDAATTLLASATLRAGVELRKFQDQCFALHWRTRNFSLDGKAMNFREFAQTSWFGPLDVSTARFCEDDLALGSLPISKAPRDEFQKALSIANERHQAINWLVYGGDVYSETDTST